MADTGRLSLPAPTPAWAGPVTLVRVAIIVAVLVLWEGVARSGLLYRDVVPSLAAIGAALAALLATPDFYRHLAVTTGEIGASLMLGGVTGLLAGLVLGGSRLLSKAFEPYLYYLGPTPNHMIITGKKMIFGVGPR